MPLPPSKSALLALVGCLASAANAAAQDPPPAPPGSAAAQPAPSLSADEAVLLALRQSPTLEVARRERNVGLIDADRARPTFWPDVIASASQTLRAPRVDLPGRNDEVVLPNSISRLEIGVRQPLYQFGAGKAPGQRASAMAGAARSDYRKAELDTVLQVREAYVSVLRAEAGARIAGRGLELARRNVETTRLLNERGLQADVDVLEADRAQAEAESRQLQADNGAALARANVNRLLGRPVDTPFSPVEVETLPEEPGPLPELAARASALRPEMTALRHNIQAAEAGIKLARASGKPRVSFDAAYAVQTETALVPGNGFAAGVSITAPLFSSAATRYTIREAEERVAQLRSALAAQEQGIALEVQQQRLAMQEARARREVALRTVSAAEKAYEITLAKLERGRAVQLEVLNGRLNLERALNDRAGAEYDLRLARVRLDRALGEGPSLEPAPPETPPRKR